MPEIILTTVFFVTLIILKLLQNEYNYTLSARIAMSAMLITTGIAHFVFVKGFLLMLPDFILYKPELIYFTGVVEFIAAIGLLLSKHKKLTGWLLIVFLVLITPSNIYASLKHVNLETATFNGEGPLYLWYRIPLQIFFIAWIYFSCIKPIKSRRNII
ncbi:hypothetical protein [Flavobacterium sp.]|uniref:DoxX family protein n=1 Tax=Flavobacterium sp. TaxID=239 RepID=UPI0032644CA0